MGVCEKDMRVCLKGVCDCDKDVVNGTFVCITKDVLIKVCVCVFAVSESVHIWVSLQKYRLLNIVIKL